MLHLGSWAPSIRKTSAVLTMRLTISAIVRFAWPGSWRWMYQAFSITREPSRISLLPWRCASALTCAQVRQAERMLAVGEGLEAHQGDLPLREHRLEALEVHVAGEDRLSAVSLTSGYLTPAGSSWSRRVRALVGTAVPAGSIVATTSLTLPRRLWVGQT